MFVGLLAERGCGVFEGKRGELYKDGERKGDNSNKTYAQVIVKKESDKGKSLAYPH